jgi:hypothetical protein
MIMDRDIALSPHGIRNMDGDIGLTSHEKEEFMGEDALTPHEEKSGEQCQQMNMLPRPIAEGWNHRTASRGVEMVEPHISNISTS